VRPFLAFRIGVATAIAAQSMAAISWSDLPPPIQRRLERTGLDSVRFPAWRGDLRARHAARVTEGDEDHLVFYALQSRRVTDDPPIEPAISARELMASLNADERARFLADPDALPDNRIPADARARLRATLRALGRRTADPRQGYFRSLLAMNGPVAAEAGLVRAYARAMRFLAQQDGAARDREPASAVSTLYHARGLSTDTSVEAGFVVREGLATLRALDPARRFRRVAIVGPGLDLAARTGYRDERPPQSIQPFAVIDALVSLGLSDLASLRVTCLDINPRVVSALNRASDGPLTLTVSSGLEASARVAPSADFLRYVETLGGAIGLPLTATRTAPRQVSVARGAGAVIEARLLDIVLDRLPLEADLVVVTNVLPYFDDRELALALANISAMLAPGGVLLHNEARPEVGVITAEIGLPLVQSRTAVLAAVRGGAPLYDTVFIHRQ
jgi:SAM-dependent methyltransferase